MLRPVVAKLSAEGGLERPVAVAIVQAGGGWPAEVDGDGLVDRTGLGGPGVGELLIVRQERICWTKVGQAVTLWGGGG